MSLKPSKEPLLIRSYLSLSITLQLAAEALPFHRTLHGRKIARSPPVSTTISRIRDTAIVQVPLLNTPYDVHRQLPVLPQRLFPMRGNLVRQCEIPSHGTHHH